VERDNVSDLASWNAFQGEFSAKAIRYRKTVARYLRGLSKLYEARWQEGGELIPPLPAAHPAPESGVVSLMLYAVLTRPVAALIL
jgi:hypothetical protein